jgi:hypothetical protein
MPLTDKQNEVKGYEDGVINWVGDPQPVLPDGEWNVLNPPKQSDWQCQVAGVTYTPFEGQEPNTFHRLMQRLILGFRWSKVR